VSAALSPDGKTVAWGDQTATDGGTLRVMDVATGKELHRFSAAAAIDHLTSPKAKVRRKSIGIGTRFTFAPDGRTLITRAVRGQVVVWDLASGKEVRRLGKALPPPTSWAGIGYLSPPGLAVSPDAKTLAVAGDGNAVTLFNLDAGQELHAPGHQAAITAVRYTKDGKALASIGGDGSVRTWVAERDIGTACQCSRPPARRRVWPEWRTGC
jgi:WD40 repeat protein